MNKNLIKLITELKAPKSQRNNFGNYNYRNCEDILEAVKPLLDKYDLLLTITDEVALIGDRYYVQAIAKLFNTEGVEIASATAYAREADSKKGMDEAQVTGAASSYARKYALNGLFLIDDTKDADSEDNSDSKVKTPLPPKKPQAPKEPTDLPVAPGSVIDQMLALISKDATPAEVKAVIVGKYSLGDEQKSILNAAVETRKASKQAVDNSKLVEETL